MQKSGFDIAENGSINNSPLTLYREVNRHLGSEARNFDGCVAEVKIATGFYA